jgi:hypothetical protein
VLEDGMIELRTPGELDAMRAAGAVVADLLAADPDADPEALRRLELTLSTVSPYRDVAAGLHLLAARA